MINDQTCLIGRTETANRLNGVNHTPCVFAYFLSFRFLSLSPPANPLSATFIQSAISNLAHNMDFFNDNNTLFQDNTSITDVFDHNHSGGVNNAEDASMHGLYIRTIFMLCLVLVAMNMNGILHKFKFHYLSEAATTIILGKKKKERGRDIDRNEIGAAPYCIPRQVFLWLSFSPSLHGATTTLLFNCPQASFTWFSCPQLFLK